jgi:hypothetical protein
MPIRVVCEAMHDGRRLADLDVVRDAKGRLVLQPEKGWRLVEVRRTVEGKSASEFFLACTSACEASILTEMSRKAGVEV